MTLEIITAILLGIGLLMTCIPTMPGIPFMFVVTLIYGFADRFDTMQSWYLAIFGGITLVAVLVDGFAGLLGAKFGGASRKAMLGGFLGLVIGLLVFPPLGAFIGLFAGVFIAEIAQMQHHVQAFKAASFSLVAAVLGMLTNVALAVAYLVVYLVMAF